MAAYVPTERGYALPVAPRYWRRMRTLNRSTLPTRPGAYYWDTWDAVVNVYTKPHRKGLFVTPPCRGAIEVRITPYIAGTFREVSAP